MRAVLVAAFLLLHAMPGVADEVPDSPASLAWLEGVWIGEEGGAAMEEIWTAPAGGILLGLHRDVFSSDKAFFEYLRIEHTAEGLVYFASPRGRPATAFKLAELGERNVVFENPEHDFPQRIHYRRDGDALVVRIEGIVDGEVRSKQWRWTRRETTSD